MQGEIIEGNGKEIVAQSQNALETAMSTDFNAEKAIAQAEKRVEFLNRICEVSLKRTTAKDWVDESGKPYLQGTGAEKLKALWGIYVKPGSLRFLQLDDDGYPAFTCTGVMGSTITHEESEFVGGRSGKDPFFANQSSCDILDIQKAAYTNLEVQGVTRLLGMRGLTWEQVEKAGINKKDAGGKVEHKTDVKGAPIPNAKLQYLNYLLLLVSDGEQAKAIDKLEELTTFEGKEGDTIKGVRSLKVLKSEKQVDVLIGKVRKQCEESNIPYSILEDFLKEQKQ